MQLSVALPVEACFCWCETKWECMAQDKNSSPNKCFSP